MPASPEPLDGGQALEGEPSYWGEIRFCKGLSTIVRKKDYSFEIRCPVF